MKKRCAISADRSFGARSPPSSRINSPCKSPSPSPSPSAPQCGVQGGAHSSCLGVRFDPQAKALQQAEAATPTAGVEPPLPCATRLSVNLT
eukprot:507505-Rhodomonas_salina.1